MLKDIICVVDFGGQYTHLIANRVRRLGVYSKIVESPARREDFKGCSGVILSGGPSSVLSSNSPDIGDWIFSLGVPLLGLCYGHQLLAWKLGGNIDKGEQSEFGTALMDVVQKDNSLFKGLEEKEQIWMSHGDSVSELPESYEVLGSTKECRAAAVAAPGRDIYGLQFHPEVTDTPNGMKILSNFLDICGCARTWTKKNFLQELVDDVKEKCEGKSVFLLVSGGVDSSVAFALMNKALGSERVYGLHIDNGLMRHRESEEILEYMGRNGFDNLKVYDASEEFLDVLKNVSDPEEKRYIIGTEFIKVKERAQKGMGLNADDWLLAQGTIYPDTIESSGTKHADKIKTHHNRVDVIIELMEKGLVIEPLNKLYKDEVRELGKELGLPGELVLRHPFPGPGLGVRTLCSDGEIFATEKGTSEKISSIAGEEGLNATVLPVKSVGVQGDERSYAHPALVTGEADWETLERVSTRMTNSCRDINRVVYGVDLPDGPEYTIEKAFVTKSRLDKLRMADHYVREVLFETGEYKDVWQMPVVLLPLLDSKGQECIVLRPVASTEAMTARFYPMARQSLEMMAQRIRGVRGIGDIFFDITHKPPATIEWE
ncbi:MAG: glutamine-hydrolyzing GMP synthase [Chitinivibrionales bacterium]